MGEDKKHNKNEIKIDDDFDMDFSRRKKPKSSSDSEEIFVPLPRKRKSGRKYGIPESYKPPRSVIVLNIVMIVLVLGICLTVFIIMFNKSLGGATDSAESFSVPDLISVDSLQSSSLDLSSDPEDVSSDISGSSGAGSWSSISDTESTPSDVSVSGTWEASEPDSSVSVDVIFTPEYFADDLFIGDSIFTGLSLYGFMDAKNVAAAVGYTPYKAMHSPFGSTTFAEQSALEYAAKMQPKRIFIMLGSNCMAAGSDLNALVSSYDELLLSLKEKCPDSTIVAISIPPVTADSSLAAKSDIKNENIRMVNSQIKSCCEVSDIVYFDLYSLVSDDNGNFLDKYAEMDGLHFMRDTYVLMLSKLEEITSE